MRRGRTWFRSCRGAADEASRGPTTAGSWTAPVEAAHRRPLARPARALWPLVYLSCPPGPLAPRRDLGPAARPHPDSVRRGGRGGLGGKHRQNRGPGESARRRSAERGGGADGPHPVDPAARRAREALGLGLGSAWTATTGQERNRLARQLLSQAIIEDKKVIAVVPRPEVTSFFELVEVKSRDAATGVTRGGINCGFNGSDGVAHAETPLLRGAIRIAASARI